MRKIQQLLSYLIITAILSLAVSFIALAAPAPQEEVTCATEYVVQADDWLSKIADKHLGDMMAYPTIVEATNQNYAVDNTFAQVTNSDLIEIGWKLCVPDTDGTITTGSTQTSAMPDMISVARKDLVPEGIEYDTANGRFLLGSITEGTIFAVNDDGTYEALIEDEEFLSTLGIEIDTARNRLLVANSNPTALADSTTDAQMYLGIYDLTSGERLHMVGLVQGELGGGHFANDITVDTEGNAYVTDTSSPAVYQVDMDGNSSLFVESDQFARPNGIIYHPNGYLLLANAGSGAIFKVPLGNPEGLTPVELEEPILGADGMVLHPNGNLIVVGNVSQTIFSLSSNDDWASATIEASAAGHPASTVALRGAQVYAIYPHFDKFFAGESSETFEIVLVEFSE